MGKAGVSDFMGHSQLEGLLSPDAQPHPPPPLSTWSFWNEAQDLAFPPSSQMPQGYTRKR